MVRPARRIPFKLRDPVLNKLTEMEKQKKKEERDEEALLKEVNDMEIESVHWKVTPEI